MGRLRDRPGSAAAARPEPRPADRSATGPRSALAETGSWLRLHSPRAAHGFAAIAAARMLASAVDRAWISPTTAPVTGSSSSDSWRRARSRPTSCAMLRCARSRPWSRGSTPLCRDRMRTRWPHPMGALAGVPLAVKDTLAEAGRPLGFGSRLLEEYVPHRDGTLAQRFGDAGLLSLVRTATPEFAFNTDTAPVSRGATLNPWDLSALRAGRAAARRCSSPRVRCRWLMATTGEDQSGFLPLGVDWSGSSR